MSAVMSTVRGPAIAELEAETAVQRTTGSEIVTVASALLLLMMGEVLGSKPRILFERYFSVDEMWAKFLESGDPDIWHSLVMLSIPLIRPRPYITSVVRAFWCLWGGSPETAFRVPSFIAIWIALVLTYTVLRRSFAILPSLVAVLALWSYGPIVMYAFFARPYALSCWLPLQVSV